MGKSQSRFTPEEHDFPDGICRFLILGKTGTGKSSLGNMLLGREEFEVVSKLQEGSESIQSASENFYGTKIEVIDTPGIFHPTQESDWAETIIAQSLVSLDPGPNIILFTISCRHRFTQEEKNAYDNVKKLLGSDASKYILIVFTAIEKLSKSVEKDISYRNKHETDTRLRQVTGDAHAHYVTFNNKLSYTSEERDKQINELLKTAKKIVASNQEKCFCSERIKEIIRRYVSEESARTGTSEEKIREELKKEVLIGDKHPVLLAILEKPVP